ncbi:hypothetical protein PPL_00878 [Heterostelium album PN500]|uniref:Ankyrin repeat protein n=1 Tax=Heterostelium pallidum (strain ATCC 26659 / Pp 5 / PN500) TaxID=670386 RepID=D3AYV9_HETP5|nr:hypothetical protein PPL_00878 [Heterostelium album PN500]EFA85649.1 hypothetical protein PPL_00878 [Heterostelium album PN500]|eukprot:XP_020437756.1 hypothetical protein PPL_00878 [Heterostelium album PN500]
MTIEAEEILFFKIFRFKPIQRLIFNEIPEIHRSLGTEGISWEKLYCHPLIMYEHKYFDRMKDVVSRLPLNEICSVGYSFMKLWPSVIFDGHYELADYIYSYISRRVYDQWMKEDIRRIYYETFEEVVKRNRIDHIKAMDRDYKLATQSHRNKKYTLSQPVKSIIIVAKHGFVEGFDYFLTKYEYDDITFAMIIALENNHHGVIQWVCQNRPKTRKWKLNCILPRAVVSGNIEMIRSLLEHGKQEYPYSVDIIRCNDIEIYKLLYLHRVSEFKAEILEVILRDVSLPLIEFMYENRSDKSVDPFQFYRANLFYILIEQDSFDKLQFFIKVRESVCYYSLIINAIRFKRSKMLRFIITSRNNENRKRYRNIKTAERLRNSAISSLQQYRRCRIYTQELSNDILNVEINNK